MTERYAGCNRDELRCFRESAETFQDMTSRSPSFTGSSFTAINCSQTHVTKSAAFTSDTPLHAPTNPQRSRLPQVVIQYLGLGCENHENSHLDRLAKVDIAPPSLISEKNIPKCKRAGESVAEEVKQGTKRAKSAPSVTTASAQIVKPSRKMSIVAYQVSTPHPYLSADHNTFSINEATSNPAPVSSTSNVQLSLNTLQRVYTWKYRPQPSQHAGSISLITPVTSMDLAQASQSQRPVGANARPSAQYPELEHSITVQSFSNSVRSTRALLAGQTFDQITEDVPLTNVSPSKGRVIATKNSTLWNAQKPGRYPSLGQPTVQGSHPLATLAQKNSPLRTAEFRFPTISPQEHGDFDDLNLLGYEDLLCLEPPLANAHSNHFPIAHKEIADKTAQQLDGLPTPQNSDNALLDAFDDDEWLQLSDVELETIDHIESMLATTSTKKMKHKNAHVQDKVFMNSQSETGRQAVGSSPSQASAILNKPIPPITRSGFPSTILDRSPLLNVTSALTLKTCFRISEALNVSAHYAQQSPTFTNNGILIELYARVISSWRTPCHSANRQNFIFEDLWSEKGPRLTGEWTGWKGSKLFELDAENLLTYCSNEGDGKMCRVIGRMKREKKEWKFVVLSAWECGWDDIETVRDIICRG